MRILEDHPSGSQPVHMRRQGLMVALQHAGPVVEIIDGDEQYIWLPILPARVVSFTAPALYAKQ